MKSILHDIIIDHIIIGTIGPGANKVAIEWCSKDLRSQPYKLWHFSLNHYRNIYGYKTKEDGGV